MVRTAAIIIVGVLAVAMVVISARAPAATAPVADRYGLTASGRIDAASAARFLVAERDGLIAATLVHEGDTVLAGQALLMLACDDGAADLAAARANAAAAAAAARLVIAGPRPEERAQADAMAAAAAARASDARDALQRAEALRTAGYVTVRRLSALDAEAAARDADAATARAVAEAARNGARHDERRGAAATAAAAAANADMAAARLAKCTLRSPVGGQVLKVLRRAGEASGSSAGTVLVVVGDMTALIVRAEVADRDAAEVRLGAPAEVWFDGAAQRWPGRVIEASALMGRKTARSLDPSDRFDRDVRQVLVALDRVPPGMAVGQRATVGMLR